MPVAPWLPARARRTFHMTRRALYTQPIDVRRRRQVCVDRRSGRCHPRVDALASRCEHCGRRTATPALGNRESRPEGEGDHDRGGHRYGSCSGESARPRTPARPSKLLRDLFKRSAQQPTSASLVGSPSPGSRTHATTMWQRHVPDRTPGAPALAGWRRYCPFVTLILETEVQISYGQFYVIAGPWSGDATAAIAGQQNGLVGAAVPHGLFIVVGPSDGSVPVTIETVQSLPDTVTDVWEDVVEVSLNVSDRDVQIVPWGDSAVESFELSPGDYRVRYCATRMDEAQDATWRKAGGPIIDQYRLQFWPAPPQPDKIIRQGSSHARYWHAEAAARPASTGPATNRSNPERPRARIEGDKTGPGTRLQERGGRTSSQRLQGLNANVWGLRQIDPHLVTTLETSAPQRQRDLARWAARRACELAGIDHLPWVAAALNASDNGTTLPPPFDELSTASAQLITDLWPSGSQAGSLRESRVTSSPTVPQRPEPWPPMAALPALEQAQAHDPLAAAINASYCALLAAGPNRRPTVLAEIKTHLAQ